jgi:polar amino acid transport system substrate-binding protein
MMRIAAILLLALPLAAGADCSRPINMVVGPELGTELDQAGLLRGPYAASFAAFGQAVGCEMAFQSMPRVRAEYMFLHGQIDVFPFASRTAERDAAGDFTPILRSRLVLLSMKSDPLKAAGIIAGDYRVAVIRSAKYGDDYLALVEKLQRANRVEETVDPFLAVRQLAHGRVVAVIAHPAYLAEAVKSEGIAEQVTADPIPFLAPIIGGMYLSRISLNAADFALLKAALDSPETRRKVWQGYHDSLPDWAAATRSEVAPTD